MWSCGSSGLIAGMIVAGAEANAKLTFTWTTQWGPIISLLHLACDVSWMPFNVVCARLPCGNQRTLACPAELLLYALVKSGDIDDHPLV